MSNFKCDIILPVCDQFEYTKGCVESIRRCTAAPYRIIVINNGTNKDTKEYLKGVQGSSRCEMTIVENKENIGWVRAINRGIELSDAPYLCFQNDDTVVTDNWLGKMINIFGKDKRIGIINPEWEGKPSGEKIDSYAKRLERSKSGTFIETDWARGFSVLVRREVVEKIGGLNDIYSPAYFDDVDFSVTAVEAGFLCVKALDTYVHHYRNKTFFEVLCGPKWNELHEKNKLIYYRRWGRPLKIAVKLYEDVFDDENYLIRISDLLLYLARRQHRIYIYSPRRLDKNFDHTNIVKKIYPPPIFRILSYADIKLNLAKDERKRYAAVFGIRRKMSQSLDLIKKSVDDMKEETKNKYRGG